MWERYLAVLEYSLLYEIEVRSQILEISDEVHCWLLRIRQAKILVLSNKMHVFHDIPLACPPSDKFAKAGKRRQIFSRPAPINAIEPAPLEKIVRRKNPVPRIPDKGEFEISGKLVFREDNLIDPDRCVTTRQVPEQTGGNRNTGHLQHMHKDTLVIKEGFE